jgi:hypothetical protein
MPDQIEVKTAQPRNQRDQIRTMNPHTNAPSEKSLDSAVVTSAGNFNHLNSMFNQRFMNHMPLGMMNMNPIVGMVGGVNSMGSGMNALFNVGTMGNGTAMRFGMGSMGNVGIVPSLTIPSIMRPQTHAMKFGVLEGLGRMGGVSTIGPSRTTRGQHSFHPYSR